MHPSHFHLVQMIGKIAGKSKIEKMTATSHLILTLDVNL